MKYWYICLTMGFWKIVDAFKPYITSYYGFLTKNVYSCSCSNMIRSFSGLLPKIPYSFSMSKFKPNVQVSTLSTECDLQTGVCNKEVIVPGYMDHCPKEEAAKRHPHNKRL